MNEITRYPDAPLKMYRVTFNMIHRLTEKDTFVTVIFPAVNEEAAGKAVHDFRWGINEATNHLYVTPDTNKSFVSVFEVETVRMFTENASD